MVLSATLKSKFWTERDGISVFLSDMDRDPTNK